MNKQLKKQTKKNKYNKGATLVEALIAAAIVGFVVVSILSGVGQHQVTSRNNGDRNVAVTLAELRMEELMKFPVSQMVEESWTDIVIAKDNGYEVFDEAADPGVERQFRRTTTISMDLLQKLATVRVVVEYGSYYDAQGSVLKYPVQVEFTSRRSY